MRYLLLFVFLTVVSLGHSQDTQEAPNANAARAYAMAKAEAESMSIKQNSADLKLHPKPLLRWNNPVSGEIYGDVYIWTLDGRPEVIASIYKWFTPLTHLSAELQSLSEASLSMSKNGAALWSPKPGLEMKLLDDAPTPSDNANKRKLQMRLIVGQFQAKAEDRSDESKTWRLRAMKQPIYRYQCPKRMIVDGGLFAFCQDNTNNPEVLLLLEARRSEGDIAWYFGLGRQNSLRFQVSRKGSVIWDVPKLAPPWENIERQGEPYFVLKTMFDD